MAYQIIVKPTALEELKALRTFEQRRIIDEMNLQLTHQPMQVTRNRKCLESAKPGFEHEPPIWELRVDDARVFYDVNDAEQTV